jgi:hypothetical protein
VSQLIRYGLLQTDVKQVKGMNEPSRLLGDGFCYPRMLMPEVGDGDTRYTV